MSGSMLRAAVVVIAVVGLIGCSVAAEDPGNASPGSEPTNTGPTELATAAVGGAAAEGNQHVTPGDPLAGLNPCDLLTDDEAAQLDLVLSQHDRGTCTWTYTGAPEGAVTVAVGFLQGQDIDKLVEKGGHTRVPTLGNHEAAIGIVNGEAPGGMKASNCRVTVAIDESNQVVIGSIVIGYEVSAGPDDPRCFGLANPVAQAIEPKLPVVDAVSDQDGPPSQASTTESGPDLGSPAQVQPCDLISDGEAAQLGLTQGQRSQARVCPWLYESENPDEFLGVYVSIEPEGIEGVVGEDITPVPSIGSHDAVTYTDADGAHVVAVGIDGSSRVDVLLVSLGKSWGPSRVSEFATDIAKVVEKKLP